MVIILTRSTNCNRECMPLALAVRREDQVSQFAHGGLAAGDIVPLRGVRPRSNPEVRDCRAPLAMTTRQWMGWRNEGGEDLGLLAGGEDQISELSGVL